MHLFIKLTAPRRWAFASLLLPFAGMTLADTPATEQWSHYGRTPSGTRFVPATQIGPQNVQNLQVAWTYRTGDLATQDAKNLPAFEATPLKVDDSLYFCTPHNVIIALDADSGKERWRFDPKTNTAGHYLVTCRGVAYHADAPASSTHSANESPLACPRRILAATLDGRLLALNAQTGQPCTDFGVNGTVSLLEHLGSVKPGFYSVTSPPTVVGDSVMVGGLVLDNQSTDVPSGVVRAFDVRTGKPLWSWDSGAIEADQTASKYTRGSANAWSVFSADPQLGLVYIPTGNRSPDYFGGERSASEERYSSSVVALEVSTGRVRWAFQTVHHDLWDYDVASQPVLTEFNGTPALIQSTKTGQLFVLDRRTGTPLSNVSERPVPGDPAPGDLASPTQPFSSDMPSLHPTVLTEEDIWGLTPIDRHLCLREFRRYRHEGLFTPPSLQGTVNYPSNLGASSWGSVAVDEQRQILIANTNRIASIVKLIPREESDRQEKAGVAQYNPSYGTPYAVQNTPFLSALGIPCTPPPWGVLTAIDLKTKQRLWEVPLGTTQDNAPLGIALKLGMPNQGGSIVTASGLVFIGAATDNYLRAFETKTGKELWKARLPAGGQATPMSYVSSHDGRQYVIIAAGGHAHMGTTLGDYLIAYALPNPEPSSE